MRIPRLHLPFDAEPTLPGAKSHANRVLVAAALTPGRTHVHGATACDDVLRMVEGLQRLGFGVEWIDAPRGDLVVDGGLPAGGQGVIDCGNAGTALRFLCAVAAAVPGEWTITGDARMQQRPIGPLVDALQRLGVEATCTAGRPPVRIRGGTLRSGATELDATLSSQFASALLLVAPAIGGVTLRLTGEPVSRSYLALTGAVLTGFGAAVRLEPHGAVVTGPYRTPGSVTIEADWSAAGVLLVLAELTHSRLRARELASDSTQGDRAIVAQIAALRGPGDRTLDLRDLPDQTMNLAVLAATRTGSTRLTGVAHLRGKESDRLAATATELGKAGVRIRNDGDELRIDGPTTWRPAAWHAHADHRLAFAAALVGSLTGDLELDDPDCVRKSWPSFWTDLAGLHRAPRALAVLGMRAAGKSTFAREVAAATGLALADTDAEFERRHGPIAAFVAARGWPAFRTEEERLVAELVRPGTITALGGGAIESARTRELLAGRACRIWLCADRATLLARLQDAPRPALTSLPLEQELDSTLARREPLWRANHDEAVTSAGEYLARHGYPIR